MRIALLPDGETANTIYRSIGPMLTLAERGHDVRQLELDRIDTWRETLRWCELLQIHRVCDGGVVELARTAKAAGAAVVWDDDDDVTKVPRGTKGYAAVGGARGRRRLAARASLFPSVDLVTTPSALLAEGFRSGGAPETRVIENYVIDKFLGPGSGSGSRLGRGRSARRRGDRDGDGPLRIGWVAGEEHRLDLEHVPLKPALERLLATHPHVQVATLGIDLRIPSDRYEHVPPVPFSRLLEQVARFDVGIAPLSPEVAISRMRSNVKVKEYAALGVPWLASPIGPYAGLGEREGGRLVPDDRWFEELDALVRHDRLRRKLAKRASRWGAGQLLSRNAGCWERAFAHAVEQAARPGAAPAAAVA